MLSNREYSSIDAIHDIYWIRNEVSSRKDALFLFEYLRLNVFDKEGFFVDKNIFVSDINQPEEKRIKESLLFIKTYEKELDPDFFQTLISYFSQKKSNLKREKDPKKTTINAKQYSDIKILWKLWWKKIEVQINLVNSKNERGFSHHLLYDAKTKIATLVRLQWYISERLINRYIQEAIDTNIYQDKEKKQIPELLQLWWFQWDYTKITAIEKNQVIKKIFTHMYETEKTFIKLDIPWKQHDVIYTTKDHRNAYHHEDSFKNMYPDWSQIKLDNKRINKKI
jgi:hypothetical protein